MSCDFCLVRAKIVWRHIRLTNFQLALNKFPDRTMHMWCWSTQWELKFLIWIEYELSRTVIYFYWHKIIIKRVTTISGRFPIEFEILLIVEHSRECRACRHAFHVFERVLFVIAIHPMWKVAEFLKRCADTLPHFKEPIDVVLFVQSILTSIRNGVHSFHSIDHDLLTK